MNRTIVSVTLLVLIGLTAAAQARELVPPQGWGLGADLEDAIKYAQDQGKPIVFVHTFKETTCPICIGATNRYTSDRSLSNFVSLMVYENESSENFFKVRRQVKRDSNFLPQLYITDPDLNVIAFVQSEDDPRAVREAANTVKQFMQWRNGVPKRVEKAEALAKRGSYSKALAEVDKIAEEDSTLTARLAVMLDRKAEEQVVADEAEAALPEGKFFPGIVADARKRFEEIADEQLAEAKKAVEAEDWITARRLLTPMSRDTADLPQIAEAKAMLEAVDTAQKQAKAAG